MAQDKNTRFNFYRRYKWRAQDFTTLQDDTYAFVKGVLEGFTGPAVLQGFEYAAESGFVIGVDAGIAVDPTGEILVKDDDLAVTGTTPGGGNTRKCLVVARSVETEASFITRPTNPFDSVALKKEYTCEVELLQGDVNGDYPAHDTETDVILFGVVLNSSGVSYVDYSKTQLPGKFDNDNLGHMKNYDMVVGKSHKKSTHAFLKEAIDACLGGERILVMEDETLDAKIDVDVANVVIEFMPGVTLTKGAAATGINVTAKGVELIRPKFKDYSGGSHYPVIFTVGGDQGMLYKPWFKNCPTNQVTDTDTIDGAAVTALILEA